LQWIATDCDQEWLAELTPIQTTLHIDAPHPIITHDARAPTIQVRALITALRAQNGATRSKRRCAFKRWCALKTALSLKTALRVQTVLRAQNGAARSKRRCALKTALRAQTVLRAQNGAARKGSAGGRQGVGRLVRRGRQRGRQIS
jgi:hypothetical protein